MLISHKHTQLVLTTWTLLGASNIFNYKRSHVHSRGHPLWLPHGRVPHFPRPEPTSALRTTGSPTQINHASLRLLQGDCLSGCSAPLPRVRAFPGACSQPLGSVHPQLPLDASTCHFHPRKSPGRCSLTAQTAPPPLHCGPRTAPGTAASPASNASPTEENPKACR